MAAKQSQTLRVYRMLLRGATTDDFCDGKVGGIAEGLANNWRARKVEIVKALRAMGGTVEKRREVLQTGRVIFRYKIWMPEEADHVDPLGWLEREADRNPAGPQVTGQPGQGLLL